MAARGKNIYELRLNFDSCHADYSNALAIMDTQFKLWQKNVTERRYLENQEEDEMRILKWIKWKNIQVKQIWVG
jgi:hypothetical protein